MARIYNFSAGPAILPEEVLKQAAAEMLDYHGSGMSVMEMSHRSKTYQAIFDEAVKDLRTLLDIPDEYEVLFLQGGATSQFAMVPMNLHRTGIFDYIDTGHWSTRAIIEAKMYAKDGDVHVVASSAADAYSYIPDMKGVKFDKDADYVYICDNNTIRGTKWKEYPETGDIPLVCDMSSCFLSEPFDIRRFGIVFAGAQKNVGPAGVTIVIIRKDLAERGHLPYTPILMGYKLEIEKGSMFNTPPTYGIYLCGLVFKWLLKNGGLAAMKKRNEEKAKLLYDCLDASSFYKTAVRKDSRSLMNVTFRTPSDELDALFLKGAAEKRFTNLKGHRSVGGLRASIYNAMPLAGVEALVSYMKEFEAAHKDEVK